MTIAWFRPSAPIAPALDDAAAVIVELGSRHDVTVFTEADAHQFVWKTFRMPYDLCVYELDNTAAHQYVWPYLLHYDGVLFLRSLTLHDSRARALAREGRVVDYVAELTCDRGGTSPPVRTASIVTPASWPMLRAPLLASRLAVVPHAPVALALQQQYPDARVRAAPTGVTAVHPSQPRQAGEPVFGLFTANRIDVVERVFHRAGGGAAADLLVNVPPEELLDRCDVALDLRWPSFGEPHTAALAAMAAGKTVVVLETDTTADWPALNPQSWQPRGPGSEPPIVVSVDPRDEEHSLAVAIRRLSADAALRGQLGAAAYDWWRTHATVRHAADAWDRLLTEAASLAPPERPANWPPHLTADGSQRAREMLSEFGLSFDELWAGGVHRGTDDR